MILAIGYGVKSVKKAHKSYKKRQAEKEEKLRAERRLPDLQDPSNELDTTCLAVASPSSQIKSPLSPSRTSSKSSSSDASAASAEKALESDPAFREYMERQKSLYLQQHRSNPNPPPPSYNSVVHQRSPTSPHAPTSAATLSPTVSNSQYTRIISSNISRPTTPIPDVPELPPAERDMPAMTPHTAKISELPNSQTQPVEIMSKEDDNDMVFELPGNLPAMLPMKRQEKPVELSSEPV